MKLTEGKSITEAIKNVGEIDDKLHGEYPGSFTDAVKASRKKEEEVEKVMEKHTEETSKDLYNTEDARVNPIKIKTEGGAKMHLNESLFEDFEDEHVGKSEECDDEECEDKKLKESVEFEYSDNTASGKLLDSIEEGILNRDDVLMAFIKWLPEDEIKEMCLKNGFFSKEELEEASEKLSEAKKEIDLWDEVGMDLDGTRFTVQPGKKTPSFNKPLYDTNTQIGIDDDGYFVWVANEEEAIPAKEVAAKYGLKTKLDEPEPFVKDEKNRKFHIYIEECRKN